MTRVVITLAIVLLLSNCAAIRDPEVQRKCFELICDIAVKQATQK